MASADTSDNIFSPASSSRGKDKGVILPSGRSMTVIVGAAVLVVVTTASALVFDFSTALGSSEDLPIVRISEYGDDVGATMTLGTSPRSTGTSTGSPTVGASTVDRSKLGTSDDGDTSRWSYSDGTTREFVPEEVWIRRDGRSRDSNDRGDWDDRLHDRRDRRGW